MATRQRKRNKNEPTCGDKLHQAYRNRAAMRRVYESAFMARIGQSPSDIQQWYWTPVKLGG